MGKREMIDTDEQAAIIEGVVDRLRHDTPHVHSEPPIVHEPQTAGSSANLEKLIAQADSVNALKLEIAVNKHKDNCETAKKHADRLDKIEDFIANMKGVLLTARVLGPLSALVVIGVTVARFILDLKARGH